MGYILLIKDVNYDDGDGRGIEENHRTANLLVSFIQHHIIMGDQGCCYL